MLTFVVRRFASMILVLFCVVTITFILAQLAPGSPFTTERAIPPAVLEQLAKNYNLNGSILENYATYLGVRRNVSGQFDGLLQGNMGPSVKYRSHTVYELIRDSLPVSAVLGGAAFLIATGIGIWLGCLAAMRHHTYIDTGSMLSALALISMPTFVVGPLLVLIFAIWLNWLPVGGWGSMKSLILPAITLAGPYIAYVARLMRSSMLEVLRQDFVRTAKAKGLTDTQAVYRHVLKVAVLPVVSFVGPLAANLLTGSIVVERIFNIPGMGPFFVNSILNRDTFLICGVVMVYCALLVFMNLVVDIAYSMLDPRIRIYD